MIFECPVVKIEEIQQHTSADKLSIVIIEGNTVVIRTEDFNIGDLAVYIPLESMVPLDNEHFTFLKDKNSPNKKHKRIKAAKLRSVFSQGLLIKYPFTESYAVGTDVKEVLGIEKYQEPIPLYMNTDNEPDYSCMPKYTDMNNYNKYKYLFNTDETVVITEKIHGCNARFTYTNERLWVGSHNCVKAKNQNNLFWQIAETYDLESKLSKVPWLVVFGEVYGRVQDLKYGCSQNEVKFAAFDAFDKIKGKYLDYEDFKSIMQELGLPIVPILYIGPYRDLDVLNVTKGTSILANNIREGAVIRPIKERFENRICDRLILKSISEDYLLRKDGTELK